ASDPSIVGEGAGHATVVVTRDGIPATLASPASVTLQTFDDPASASVPCDPTLRKPDGTAYPTGQAYARCDYATTVQTLMFAPGETQKTVNIPIIDDVHVEGTEIVPVRLSNPVGATLELLRSGMHVVIHDNDSGTAQNPSRTTAFFVRLHYLDFLSREPEPNEPWSAILNNCPDAFNLDARSPSAACDRLIVSQSFFGAPEFRLKGLYVYLFYRIAFNRRPEYAEIIPDMSALSGATAAEVFARRAALPVSFTARQEFKTRYDALTDTAFVNALLDPYGLQQITTPDPQQPEATARVVLTRAELSARLGATGAQALTRAQVLRAVVESSEVGAIEYNGAFVAMQYYGYLRRTPEESGYQAWLKVINEDPNNVRIMVNGFLNSTEYRLRFGQP
ncbi:MAG TPA: Calx-beta domain-containing protein, partial [Pyrinomonadaceae bacterium]|nr:Calx-beta domain-containing protein [Pyrinomonadaceae bacterium]